MFCKNCGKELNDTAVFCPFCGTKVEETQTAQQEQAAAVTPAPQPTETVQPAQSAQPAVPAYEESYPTYTDIAPVSENAEPLQEITVPAVPKKKKKAGLIAGITAAAVVAGGAGVGYFGFRDSITHAFLGDAGYAQMIDTGAMKALRGRLPASNGKMSSAAVTGTVAYLADRPEDKSGTGSIMGGTSKMLGSLLRAPVTAAEAIPDGSALTSEYGIQLQTGSLFPENETTKFVCEMLNGINARTKLVNGTDTDSFGIQLFDESGDLGGITSYSADGYFVEFPGITEKTVSITKEDLENLAGQSMPPNGRPAKMDEEQALRIVKELAKIYYASYKQAGIEYSDNTERLVSVKDAKVNIVGCTYVTITWSSSQLKAMLNDMIAFLREDEYLIGYAKDSMGLSEDDYKARMKDIDDDFDAALSIGHIADKDGKALTTDIKLSVEKTKSSIEIKSSTEGSNTVITADLNIGKKDYNDKDYTMTLHAGIGIARRDETDGKAYLLLSRYDNRDNGDGSGSGKGTDTVFECDYEGFGKAEWLGYKLPVGTFRIKLAEPDAFVNMIKESNPYLFKDDNGDAVKYLDELKKLGITIESRIGGDTADAYLTISAGDIGNVTFDCTSTLSEETVTMPDTSNAIRLSDKETVSEKLSGLGGDFNQWLIKLLSRSDYAKEHLIPLLDGSYREQYDTYHPELDGESLVNNLNSAASELSGHMEAALKIYDDPFVSRPDDKSVMLMFATDGKGVPCELDGMSGFNSGIIDEIKERMALYAERGEIYNDLYFAYYFFDGEYVGTCVLDANNNHTSFTDAGLPTAGDFANGFFGGWCDANAGKQMPEPGYFINKSGELSYAGTYCVSTNSELMYRAGGEDVSGIPDEVTDLNEHAKGLSAAAESASRLYSAPIIKQTDSADVMLVFIADDSGRAKEQVIYDGYEQKTCDYFDEEYIKDIKDYIGVSLASGVDEHKGLFFNYHYHNGKYVGTTVLRMGAKPFAFLNDPGLPTASDFENGYFSGWCGTAGGTDTHTPGCFINKDGTLSYAGTYCTATQSELVYKDAGDFINSGTIEFEGIWAAKNVVGDIVEPVDSFLGMNGVDATSDGIGGELLTEIYSDHLLVNFNGSGDLQGKRFYVLYYYNEEYNSIVGYLYETEEAKNKQDIYGVMYGESTDLYIYDYKSGVTMRFEKVADIAAGGIGDLVDGDKVDLTGIENIAGAWSGMYRGENGDEEYPVGAEIFTDGTLKITAKGDIGKYSLRSEYGVFYVYDDSSRVGKITHDVMKDTISVTDLDSNETVEMVRNDLMASGDDGFGAPKSDPVITDITGTWTGTFMDEEITLDFNEALECWGDGDRSTILHIKVCPDGFEIIDDDQKCVGFVEYSPVTDSIRVMDFINNETVIMTRKS